MTAWLFGIVLGWGAAIPIGPINVEITRRNLTFGTPYGLALGAGACLADVTYLVLLGAGLLIFLDNPSVMRLSSVIGALILIWFGIKAFRAVPSVIENNQLPSGSMFKHGVHGYLLTLINPYTVLFWAGVSSQVSIQAQGSEQAVLYAGIGVLMGTLSWVCFLNGLLHVTRHRLSTHVIRHLNHLGGIILLMFAAYGLYQGVFIM